ncbi:fimbrin [Thecamonas trahens ATCC 50062]|uniref:Fimbrin n=1 Tax=Thecamonas trahens ATCC 50062 TaxID=461836 RepID=A0A0L0DW70_THETB|nr:fimbrin [Thecamonas trahens ATCC 50062]KNC56427.1 fimbrin [Thecamonas trahens ATCC 50062]|eukprot:XP_013760939.1 fimbrin [Thecamonas trahens ATCC 50062]
MAAKPTVADYRAIARGFPSFNTREVNDLIRQFQLFDDDGNGSIDTNELRQVMVNMEMDVDEKQLQEIIAEVDEDNSGTIEFAEFMVLMKNAKTSGSKMAAVVEKAGDMYKVQGATDSSAHSFSEEEKTSFSDYINMALAHDSDLAHLLPIDAASMDLFEVVKDGILLCKLINEAVPGTIDERAINKKPKNAFSRAENLNMAVASAAAIGVNVVNLGQDDLTSGKHHIVLGLIWQLIRIGLMRAINLEAHPELYRLLEEGESIEDLMRLPADQILLRWLNYHLAAAGSPRRATNFGKDLSDSEILTTVLAQVGPPCDMSPMNESDKLRRADAMLAEADKIECRKFVTPNDVTSGNSKLNLLFVANLFNTHPGLAELTEEEAQEIDMDFDLEGDREARVFALYLSSLGVPVTNLYEDLRDGLALLKAFDAVEPGIVNWKKVATKVPIRRFSAIANCNYAVVLGKSLHFSLVGVSGDNINEGDRTRTLAVVWQLCRFHLLKVLRELGGGAKIEDADMIKWANDTVGGVSTMRDFRDKSLSNAVFFLDLINAIKPGIVEAEYVIRDASSEEDKTNNARYAIALARKLGALIFLLPEDVVEVRPKLILTLVGTLMQVAKRGSAGPSA